MKTVLSLYAVLASLLAATAHAQTKEALETAQRLVVRSGISVQLRSMPQQFDPELALARGSLPDEVITALGEAAKQSFVPEALQADITQSLAAGLSVADMKQALDWLDTGAGRRITAAEVHAAGSMTPQAMQAHLESLKRKPHSARRAELLAQLVVATKGVEHTANLVEGVALGIAMGMDATQPVQKRQGLRDLRERLRSAMPPERIRESVAAALPNMYGYIYRDVTDADLSGYLQFSRSAAGARYNDAVIAAFTEAMVRASVRMGPAIERALQKKST